MASAPAHVCGSRGCRPSPGRWRGRDGSLGESRRGFLCRSGTSQHALRRPESSCCEAILATELSELMFRGEILLRFRAALCYLIENLLIQTKFKRK